MSEGMKGGGKTILISFFTILLYFLLIDIINQT